MKWPSAITSSPEAGGGSRSAGCSFTPGRPRTSTRKRGVFIALEGGEGAGKSTLAAALEQRLRASGRDVILTREPGGTDLGDAVSEMVRHLRGLTPRAELLLFEAARAQHVQDVIRPALERGDIVLCDRFTASSIAYQGYGRELPILDVAEANRIATEGLEPDLTLLLDLPPEAGLRRDTTDPEGDRLRGERAAFHERVRAGYLEQAAADPEHWRVIDATQPREAVLEAAWARIATLL